MRHTQLRHLIGLGTQIVMPDVCAGCGQAGAWICDDCWQSVKVVDQSRACGRCGYPRASGASGCRRCEDWGGDQFEIRSAYEFSGALRQSVLRLKYHGEYARAGWHGHQVAELARTTGWRSDVLIPVPLHRRRMRRRGYNQSEKVALVVGSQLAVEVRSVLRRERDTPSQTSLPARDRRTNIIDAFACIEALNDRSVILIDDVVTTGSTLLECARVCLQAGAEEVRALTIASDV